MATNTKVRGQKAATKAAPSRRRTVITDRDRGFTKPKAATFNYSLDLSDPLDGLAVGQTVHKTVRAMSCIYKGGDGFAIYEVDEDLRRFTILGDFPYDLPLNAYYKITGEVVLDKKGRRQVKVSQSEATLPQDRDGIITVLRTLHGLDTQAHKLYDKIGDNVLTMICEEPEKVAELCEGVSLISVKGWQKDLQQRCGKDEELKKLYGMGLTPRQAARLVAKYGISICEEVRRNPYAIIGKVEGFTFKKCDKAALDAGFEASSRARLREGLICALQEWELRGHCACKENHFWKIAHQLLDISIGLRGAKQILGSVASNETIQCKVGEKIYSIDVNALRCAVEDWDNSMHKRGESFHYVIQAIDDELLRDILQELHGDRRIILEDVDGEHFVISGYFHRAECDIASNVRDLILNERLPFDDVDKVISAVLSEMGVTLEVKQMEAVRRICDAEGGLFILNGSAGCGKTFTLNIIMRVLKRLYKERKKSLTPCILAPTGKAGKVASQATNLPAQTIHRALRIVSSADDMEANKSLENNCVVIDEFSMVDEMLCAAVLKGVKKTTKVILLGDTEQLPSIRAGRVLKDFIESKVIPTVTLDVVKRQSAKSGVLYNANKIIRGENIETMIVNPNGNAGNAYIEMCDDPFDAQERIIALAKNYGLGAFQKGEVQVLCPLKAGATGVEALNFHLQEKLNPVRDGQEIVVGKLTIALKSGGERSVPKTFRIGDCVIHTQNDYEKPWYEKSKSGSLTLTTKTGVLNGDVGVVDSIRVFKDKSGTAHRVMYVRYDDHYIAYDNEFSDVMLSYAMTVHKSQGSQWKTVIAPMVQPTILLNRKLLYTLYTRAQETNGLIGRGDLIANAIRNNSEDHRVTLLKHRLTEKKF